MLQNGMMARQSSQIKIQYPLSVNATNNLAFGTGDFTIEDMVLLY